MNYFLEEKNMKIMKEKKNEQNKEREENSLCLHVRRFKY